MIDSRRQRITVLIIVLILFIVVLFCLDGEQDILEVEIKESTLLTVQENKSKQFQDESIVIHRVEVEELVVATLAPVESIVKAKRPKVVAPTRSNDGFKRVNGTFEITAYCACTKCCGPTGTGTTATGTKVTPNRTIAVDPRVIPLGSKVKIEGRGDVVYVAEDTGGAIKGNKLDIYFETHQEALNFGRQKNVKVYID